MMDLRQQEKSPKREQNKDKAAGSAPGKTASTLPEFPARRQQAQIKQPDENRIIQQGIILEPNAVFLSYQKRTNGQAGGEQKHTADQKAIHDPFEALNGRKE